MTAIDDERNGIRIETKGVMLDVKGGESPSSACFTEVLVSEAWGKMAAGLMTEGTTIVTGDRVPGRFGHAFILIVSTNHAVSNYQSEFQSHK